MRQVSSAVKRTGRVAIPIIGESINNFPLALLAAVRRPATIRHQSNRELRSTIGEQGGRDILIVQEADRPTGGFVCHVSYSRSAAGLQLVILPWRVWQTIASVEH
jgi:hypothetical protein